MHLELIHNIRIPQLSNKCRKFVFSSRFARDMHDLLGTPDSSVFYDYGLAFDPERRFMEMRTLECITKPNSVITAMNLERGIITDLSTSKTIPGKSKFDTVQLFPSIIARRRPSKTTQPKSIRPRRYWSHRVTKGPTFWVILMNLDSSLIAN